MLGADRSFLDGLLFRRFHVVAVGRLRCGEAVFHLPPLFGHDADAVHELRDVRLDLMDHLLEHIVALDLVFHQRIALAVSAEVDALPQHIHVVEMFHPLVVDDAQHDDLFQLAHDAGGELRFARLVVIVGNLFQRLPQLVAAHGLQLFLLQRAFRRVNPFRVLDQAVQRPFLRIELFVGVLVHLGLDDFLDHIHDALAKLFALQHLAALRVNDLALLVHHVVVFEHVLAHVEIPRLDLLLGVLDGAGDDRMLDRLVFFHAELIHDFSDALGGEQPQQVVLQRQIEPRRAGIALTTGTAAKLIVDAP